MESQFLKNISEIEQARLAGFVRPALYESLSIIDLCGKAEFDSTKSKERFIKWVKQYLYDDGKGGFYFAIKLLGLFTTFSRIVKWNMITKVNLELQFGITTVEKESREAVVKKQENYHCREGKPGSSGKEAGELPL